MSGKQERVINEKRFLDPTTNKLPLNKFHQIDRKHGEHKKTLTKKIRDVKKLITHAETHVSEA